MNRSKKKSFDWYGARQRFSIRKYHIGAASVLLGMTLVLSTGTIVGAETGVNGDGASNEQIVPGNDAGTSNGTTNPTANDQPAGDTGSASSLPVGTSRSADTGTQGDGSTHQPVDEPIIKFPTQDNQAKPAGYQKVEFSTAYSTLVFEGNPGEIQNGNSKTVVFWVKTGTTWGALMSDPQFRIPKYTVADGDFILGYAKNVGQVAYPIDFDSLKDTPIVDTWQINTIVDYIIGDVTDGRTFEEYMNSGSYAPFYIPQFHGITLDANGGTVGGKAKKAFYVAYQHVQWGDQRVTSKIVDPSRDGYTFVRWQTATGERIPTSGQIDTIEFTAVWLEHPTDKVAVFDRTNLTDSEKEQVKKKIYDANPDLSTGVAQVIKAIEISDTGEATVTFDDNKVVTVSSTTLINEDQDTARSNAKAEIEQEATEKSDAINASALTEEEKIAKLAEVDNKKAAADSAIDRANTSDELNTALEAGKSAIAGIDTSTSAKKTQAKQDLETAYNAEQNEIANSSLTRGEKDAKQAELDQAKSAADSAIDAATTDSAVESALTNGKAAIESTYTAIIKIPSSATATAPQGYVTVTFEGTQYTRGFELGNQTGSLVKVFVKNDVTWGTLLDDPAWQWPTVKTAPGDTVVGWAMNIYYGQSYNPNNAFAREKYKDTVVTNTKLYPNVVYEVEDVNYATKEQYLALYGSDDRDKWIIITFDAGQGRLSGSKQSKMVAVSNNLKSIDFSNSLFTGKVESPTLQGHTFVRWQTDAGEVLPKSGPITTETTYKALYLAHPQNKVAVFDSANLTTSEKEQVKKNILDANPDLSTGVAPAIKAIDISDTGEATVTFDDDTVVTVSSATLTNEDQDTARSNAKAEIEREATEKSDAINASNLTEEEKREKLDEVNNAKAAADRAIDQASTSDELNQALNNGKTEIGNVPVTSQGKAAALAELQSAKEAKLQAIENSNLTDEEKSAATQAVNTAYDTAVNNINSATTNDAVAQALNNGKTEIGNVPVTSQGKAAALAELQSAKEAKLQAIENSNLTDEEKSAATQAVNTAYDTAVNNINSVTTNDAVAQALTDGKTAIAGIDTNTSAKKAQAKQDLETAYNAKKDEIAKSSLTAEEKAAKQAELDKAKADADKAIDAATDASGVAKALEAGKAAIDAINTSTSAEKAAAKKDLEAAYNAKKDEIAKSSLTAEEKAAKQAELDKAKADADKAIDAATDASGVAKALEDGKAAIDAIDAATKADEVDTATLAGEKAAAKKDLEAAYNAKKAEIENSALTAEEKAAKQAELDKAKADADKAIDAATDASGVAKALEAGKVAIDAIDTSTSAGIDTSSSAKKARKENKVLPKTGDNVGLSSVLGIAGLALLGTAIRKKRED
ncbi:DUF1542 domain-containing protein [Streptococcus suis]|uniref:DUF1542 domain-containing protein n=1 Tax=Streptococcus suis TaxID=1307 RepID=UPI001C94DCA5|nr:DUF1542 domain-containing protein [Streptococcus suis]MBY4970666.1 DUF1542 domain-containing protein [Streptococcus suis]MBY5008261.1 DUF1542 domain-containing protein [Streptococcus suis]MBY5032171.1 DUF1542 domain-containing protein [Streptococcus suis]MBY5036674.1 DUF1542 domain-containing protein [Streptococcus suis]